MTEVTRESLAAALHDSEVGCLYRDENEDKPLYGDCPNREFHQKDAALILAALPSPAPEPPPGLARLLAEFDEEWDRWDDGEDEHGNGIPPERSFKVPFPLKEFIKRLRERAAQPAPDLDPTQIGFQEMVTLLDRWLQANYPPTVFDGSSGDEGAVFVTRLRRAMGELGHSRVEALEKLADSHARSVLSKSESDGSGGEP